MKPKIQLFLNQEPKDAWIKHLAGYFSETNIPYIETKHTSLIKPEKGPAIVLGLIRGSDTLLDSYLSNKNRKFPFYYIDNPYVWCGERKKVLKKWKRLCKNNFAHNELEKEDEISSGHKKRLIKHSLDKHLSAISDWKKDGKYILLCPSSTRMQERILQRKVKEEEWEKETIKEIKKYTDRPIKVKNKGTTNLNNIIPPDFKNVFACVTFTSMAAIEALKFGVPSFCHQSSAAAPLSLSNLSLIESPIYPDNREQLVKTLMLHQFSVEEFKNGTAWEFINRKGTIYEI